MALTRIKGTVIKDGSIENADLPNSGVTADTYGEAAAVPVITVNEKGIITGLSTTPVAGVSDVAYDSSTGVLTIDTSDGSTFTEDLGVGTADSPTFVGVTVTSSIEIGDHSAGAGATLSWNAVDGTVDMAYDGVSLQVGQEQHFYGKASEAISNGDVVMFAGIQGDHPLLAKADMAAVGFKPEWVMGVATQDFAANDYGYVTTFGYVRDIDTTAFNVGDILYLDASTPGALTATEPAFPAHSIMIAAVAVVNANVGSILVRPSHKDSLDELQNVAITSVSTNDIIKWNGTNWVNDTYPGVESTDYNTSTGVLTINSHNGDTFTEDLGVGTADTPEFAGLDLTVQGTPLSHNEGRLYYNSEYKTVTMFSDITDVSLQIGQEEWVRVYNSTGSTITNGTPCRATGANGELPSVAPANATSAADARVLGIATHDIPDGTSGYLTTRGMVSGLDTSSLTSGLPIYLAVDGSMTNTAPTYPYYLTWLGGCVVSDASDGYIYVDVSYQTLDQLRVENNGHIGGSLTIDGDLVVTGTQSIVSQNNLAVADSFVYLNSGDNIGPDGTTFSGSGLDDAYFQGYYKGLTSNSYEVTIDATGTPDTFSWSRGGVTQATGVAITGGYQELEYELGINFNATTGHTVGDSWSGTATPVNVDTGWATNRNTGTTGVGYTHMGVFFDASDEKFKFFDEYDPEPSGSIDTGDASFSLGTVVADTFEGTATNSQLLDSLDSSQFLRSDVDDNITGDIMASGQWHFDTAVGTQPLSIGRNNGLSAEVLKIGVSDTVARFRYIEDTTNEGTLNYGAYSFDLAGNAAETPDVEVLFFDYDNDAFRYKGNTVWHGGNDGTGSGLDADLLDGIQSTQFLRTDQDNTSTGDLYLTGTGQNKIDITSTDYTNAAFRAGVTDLGGYADWYSTENVNTAKIRGYASNGVQAFFNAGDVGIGSATPNASLAIHRTDTNATFRVNREGVGASAIQLTADNLYTSIYSTKGSQPLLLGTANAEGIRIETDGKLWTKRGLHIDGGDTLTNQYGIVISRNSATNQAGRIWTSDSSLIFESIQDEVGYGGFFFRLGATATGGNIYSGSGGNFVIADELDSVMFTVRPDGDTYITGTLTELSSIKVKENLEAITPKDSLEKVLQLKPYTYDRIDNGTKGESGLIAEDLEQVLPNLVKETDDGTKSVSYTKLVPYLIGAIQELQKEIEELKKNG